LLFIVYLEAALKSVRQEIDNEVQEMVYNDDIDFISSQNLDIGKIEKSPEKWQLKLNCAKIETTKISLDDNDFRKTLKLGIKLETKEDIKRRKALAMCAMNNLSKIRSGKEKINKKKIRIFKAYVESVLLYDCETWGINKTTVKEINRFKRRLMRRVLGVF